jgi:hypothetical protein
MVGQFARGITSTYKTPIKVIFAPLESFECVEQHRGVVNYAHSVLTPKYAA